MKKSLFLVFALIFIIMLAGCSNKDYEEAMDSGKEAIKAAEYEDAISSFERALEEKADDKVATAHLDQTTVFTDGVALFHEGELESSTDKFNEVLQFEEGSSNLHSEAKKQLTDIEKIEDMHDEVGNSIKKAKEFGDKGKFKEALALIDETLENDLTHASLSSGKENLESLQTEVKAIKKTYDNAKKAFKEAEKLSNDKAYKEALVLLDESLQKDYEHAALASLKEDLTKLQTDVTTAIKDAEAQDEKQALINRVIGYWSHTDHEFDVCHFTNEHFICATVASDVHFYGYITSWDANIDDETVTLTMDDGSPFTVSVSDPNTLALNNGTYRRVSLEELESDILGYFGAGPAASFFDIKKIEAWD